MSDSLAFGAVDRHLKGRFGRPYTYLESCGSTQLLFDDGAPASPPSIPYGGW